MTRRNGIDRRTAIAKIPYKIAGWITGTSPAGTIDGGIIQANLAVHTGRRNIVVEIGGGLFSYNDLVQGIRGSIASVNGIQLCGKINVPRTG